MRRVFFLTSILLAGCGRYAEFTLPAPDAAGPWGPFKWEAASGPVLTRGDAVDVLNPSVIRFHGQYFNLYSEYDGQAWHTAIATSPDGVAWRKQARVLSPDGGYIAANGSALVDGNEILYWYETGDPLTIALASSTDGEHFQKRGDAVLKPGPRGSFDERGVSDPYVIRAGAQFYLFYIGLDRGRRQHMGVARSSDGVRWEKLRSAPILSPGGPASFDENGVGEPAVWTSGGVWWMLYTGRDRSEHRRMGLAESTDGIHWNRDLTFPAIADVRLWDSQVVCDPSVEVTPQGVRVWFGGGDRAEPAENLHGQIGVGILLGR